MICSFPQSALSAMDRLALCVVRGGLLRGARAKRGCVLGSAPAPALGPCSTFLPAHGSRAGLTYALVRQLHSAGLPGAVAARSLLERQAKKEGPWFSALIRQAHNVPRRKLSPLSHYVPYKAQSAVLPEMEDVVRIDKEIKAAVSIEELAVPLLRYGGCMSPDQVTACLRRLPVLARRQRTPAAYEQQLLPATVISAVLGRATELLPRTSTHQFSTSLWALATTWRSLTRQLHQADKEAQKVARRLQQLIEQATALVKDSKAVQPGALEDAKAPAGLAALLQDGDRAPHQVLSALIQADPAAPLKFHPLPPPLAVSQPSSAETCLRSLQQCLSAAEPLALRRASHVQQLRYLQQASLRWPWEQLSQYLRQHHGDMPLTELARCAWALAALKQAIAGAHGSLPALVAPDTVLQYVASRIRGVPSSQAQLGVSGRAVGASESAGSATPQAPVLTPQELSEQLGWRGIAQLAAAATQADIAASSALLEPLAAAMSHRLSAQLQARHVSQGVLVPRCMYRYLSIRGWKESPQPRPPKRSKYLRSDTRPPRPLDFTPAALIHTLSDLSRVHAAHGLYLPEGLLSQASEVLVQGIPSVRLLDGPAPVRGRDAPVYRPGEEPEPQHPAFQLQGMRLTPRTARTLLSTWRTEERSGDLKGALGRAVHRQLTARQAGSSLSLSQTLSLLHVAVGLHQGPKDGHVVSLLNQAAVHAGLDVSGPQPRLSADMSAAELARLLQLTARMKEAGPLAQSLALAGVQRSLQLVTAVQREGTWLSPREAGRILTAVWLLPRAADAEAQAQLVRMRQELSLALQDWMTVHVPAHGGRDALLCAAALSIWPAHSPRTLNRVAGRAVSVPEEWQAQSDGLVKGWVAKLSPKVLDRLTQSLVRAQKQIGSQNALLRFLPAPSIQA